MTAEPKLLDRLRDKLRPITTRGRPKAAASPGSNGFLANPASAPSARWTACDLIVTAAGHDRAKRLSGTPFPFSPSCALTFAAAKMIIRSVSLSRCREPSGTGGRAQETWSARGVATAVSVRLGSSDLPRTTASKRLPLLAENGNRTARPMRFNKKPCENGVSRLPLLANSGNRFGGETRRVKDRPLDAAP
jgi:hypothetical protein